MLLTPFGVHRSERVNAATFLRSLKRFTARRGIPAKVLSDNVKTFKSADRIIWSVCIQ